MAWPPATYDVISRNHSNRFSPNLRQNVSKGYAYSYWKRHVADEKSSRKNWRKTLQGWHPPPLVYARGLKSTILKMDSYEHSRNQKIVTDGFPWFLGMESKICFLRNLKSYGLRLGLQYSMHFTASIQDMFISVDEKWELYFLIQDIFFSILTGWQTNDIKTFDFKRYTPRSKKL